MSTKKIVTRARAKSKSAEESAPVAPRKPAGAQALVVTERNRLNLVRSSESGVDDAQALLSSPRPSASRTRRA